MTEITLKMIFRIRNQRLVMDFVHQKTAGNGGFLILTKTMSRAAVGTMSKRLKPAYNKALRRRQKKLEAN